jgi:hypothetical protein
LEAAEKRSLVENIGSSEAPFWRCLKWLATKCHTAIQISTNHSLSRENMESAIPPRVSIGDKLDGYQLAIPEPGYRVVVSTVLG